MGFQSLNCQLTEEFFFLHFFKIKDVLGEKQSDHDKGLKRSRDIKRKRKQNQTDITGERQRNRGKQV